MGNCSGSASASSDEVKASLRLGTYEIGANTDPRKITIYVDHIDEYKEEEDRKRITQVAFGILKKDHPPEITPENSLAVSSVVDQAGVDEEDEDVPELVIKPVEE